MPKLVLLSCLALFPIIPQAQSPPRPLVPTNLDAVQARMTYPVSALSQGIEGTVWCEIEVDEQGQYQTHRIISSPDEVLSTTVSAQVSLLQFETPEATTPTDILIPFTFKLQGKTVDPGRFYLNEGRNCRKAGFHELADYWLSLGIQHYRKNRQQHQQLALALYERSHNHLARLRWGDARADLTAAILMAQHSTHPMNDVLPSLYLERLQLALLAGRPHKARADLRRLATDFPTFIPQQAQASLGPGTEGRLLSGYAFLAQLDRSDPGPMLFYLSGHIFNQMGQYTAANTAWENAFELAVHPVMQAACLTKKSLLMARSGALAPALSKCQEAIHLAPQYQPALQLQGELLLQLGYPTEGLSTLGKAWLARWATR